MKLIKRGTEFILEPSTSTEASRLESQAGKHVEVKGCLPTICSQSLARARDTEPTVQ